jgi:protein tyrosine/serine phosphatase
MVSKRVVHGITWAIAGFAVLGCGLALSLSACNEDDAATSQPFLFNFYALDEGKAYRSAQLSGQALSWVVDRHAIKTVINLRGPNAGKPWYDEEATTCKAKNVTLVDIPMSSKSLPEPQLLESIVEALRTAEYPILIHCESGSDRSGAVSALYRIDILKQDRAEAMKELSPDYWHFRAKKPCMDKLAEIYEPTAEWMQQYERDYEQITCE